MSGSKVIRGSSQNCIQDNIDKPCILPRIKVSVTKRLSRFIQSCHGNWSGKVFLFLTSFLRISTDGMEGVCSEKDLLKREIETHPVVSSVSVHTVSGSRLGGYHVKLRCWSAFVYGRCTDGDCKPRSRWGPFVFRGIVPHTWTACVCSTHESSRITVPSVSLQRDHDKLTHQ